MSVSVEMCVSCTYSGCRCMNPRETVSYLCWHLAAYVILPAVLDFWVQTYMVLLGNHKVYILGALIDIVANRKSLQWWWGSILVLGTFFVIITTSVANQMCVNLSLKVGMKIRSTVSMAVFNKLLRTRLVGLVGANSGYMLNIVTNDTQKLLDGATYFNFVWFSLVDLAVVSLLAALEVGSSAVPGIIVALLTQPIMVWMARKMGTLRAKAVRFIDARIHLTGELISGIQVIKYNGWTTPFLKHVANLRQDEVKYIRRVSFVRASYSALRDMVLPLSVLATFATYFVLHEGNFMPTSRAFRLIALFYILVRTFGVACQGGQAFGEAVVAVRRLEALLDMCEDHGLSTQDNSEQEYPVATVMALNCYFSWNAKMSKEASDTLTESNHNSEIIKQESRSKISIFPRSTSFETQITLQNISLSAQPGELVCIHGAVGSGKSSLLYGLLGEMKCLQSTYFTRCQVAYVPQQPWILNTTVRKNIIFTTPFDPERYQKTIESCALEHDISQFLGGHEAEIGDRGINLSGGQKARISLARACYSFCPVVFLDDPLAAVDVPTANHLIKHVLKGILRGRTIILVTHNRMVLDISDCNYEMQNGCLLSMPKDAIMEDVHGNYDTEVRAIAAVSKLENQTRSFVEGCQLEMTEPPKKIRVEDNELSGKTTVQENQAEGNIPLSTWLAYIKASGGFPFFSFVMLVFIFGQAIRTISDYWLIAWVNEKYHLKPWLYLLIYSSLVGGAVFFWLTRGLLFSLATMMAATQLHWLMAEHVLHSPLLFFDQNVAGRILNRFSKDQSLVDEVLPNTIQLFLEYLLFCIATLLLVGVLIPWFLLIFPPFLFVFLYLQHRYVAVSRELKRIEAIARSPVYAHIGQAFQGIVSIRAYGIEGKMHDTFLSLIDANHRAFILLNHLARWMGIRMDCAVATCVAFVSALVILLRASISPALAGVALSQIIQVAGYLQFAVKQGAEVENYMTSVERIHEYCKLQTEVQHFTVSSDIDADWPSQGELEWRNYTMAYRIDLPPILDGISLKVNAREKVGILGRTGVGKSSLAASLFRMVENSKCSGDIFIDGVNIKEVGLNDLRQRLSMIPQDPILFEGTLRFNLDPFGYYSDAEIYNTLSEANLLEKIKFLNKGLDSLIIKHGNNFSVGERQLICLARSLLRKTQVVVMDEATSAVDVRTDSLIQATIRTAFQNCTVLTIAHRIETVIDSDRIIILATGGQIAEFDSPSNLLRYPGSIFAEMVEKTGPLMSKRLHEAAYAAERTRIDRRER